jgi:hypothetical protein
MPSLPGYTAFASKPCEKALLGPHAFVGHNAARGELFLSSRELAVRQNVRFRCRECV